ncbi:MAG: M48 family metalloprotease [Bacteroidetes bacterium]|nr:M48 family metalloprotease [Bacteroidota bacterium]MCH8522931.1 M48 family metalloprotease [Balneolales bacterium]
MSFRIKSGLLAVVVFFTASCMTFERSPVTDSRRAYAFTWQQEINLGREADDQIIEYYGLYDDPELTAYITAIGKKVLAESHMRRESTRTQFRETAFTFRILDSPVVNAFALPGGFNYVTRGLLTHMTSEAQLAMVIGHEIAHVAARHASQQALRQQAGQILLIGTAVLGQELLGIPGQEIIGLGGSAAQLLFLSYSRDAEREADRLGVEYAAKAGYAAAEGAAFFTTLRRISEKAGHSIPSHLSSHPDPGEREVDIVRRAEMWRERGFPQEIVRQREFYTAIDGMTMGENPRHGFTRNDVFYHPELAFSFPVPSNWNVINERNEVILVNSSQQAVTIFTISDKATAAEAVDEIGNLEQITSLERESIQINGLSGARVVGNMMDGNTTYRVEVTGVEHQNRVYRFLSYAPEANASEYSPVFRRTATGFSNVTDSAILDIQPARIQIVTADRSAPFSSFIPDNLPDGMDPEDLAIINHVELNETIAAGTLLKIPR